MIASPVAALTAAADILLGMRAFSQCWRLLLPFVCDVVLFCLMLLSASLFSLPSRTVRTRAVSLCTGQPRENTGRVRNSSFAAVLASPRPLLESSIRETGANTGGTRCLRRSNQPLDLISLRPPPRPRSPRLPCFSSGTRRGSS